MKVILERGTGEQKPVFRVEIPHCGAKHRSLIFL
jgi:hypothetical protein